ARCVAVRFEITALKGERKRLKSVNKQKSRWENAAFVYFSPRGGKIARFFVPFGFYWHLS
ncbi:MAG: hypothetical protein IJ317_04670, partial [Clostridia bacterium]|nr:hypothetical protein [Clostridia bacterium]